MQFTTNQVKETRALGQRLAERLKPGQIVAFTGDLGAGKTPIHLSFAPYLHNLSP